MQKKEKRDFDAAAAGWDQEPRRVKLARDVADAIRRELPLNKEMVVLDYGCGSGLVTLGLSPLVGRITGADSSTGMLDVLKRKLQEQAISNVDTMLIDLEQQQPLPERYDLIVSSMTMHHVQDVEALIKRFIEQLKPGGWLALADLEQEDGSFHSDLTGVLHHGFERGFFGTAFAGNGLSGVRTVTAASIEKPGEQGSRFYPVLLCLGRKSP